MFRKLSDIDVRILYLIMVVVVTAPLLKPIGLPVPVAQQTLDSFNAIETNIEKGDLVLLGVDFAPNMEAEMWPQLMSVGSHVAGKGAKLVLLNMIAGGFRYQERFLEHALETFEMEYGVDVISLPFSAGREAAFQALATDLKNLYEVDFYGTPLKGLPLWDEIKSVKDFKMYVEFADAPDWWLRPMRQASDLLLWNGTVASGASTMAPLYQSGQLCGLIMGMAGGAEYEILTEKPGLAAAAMDGQSMGHGLIILFVLLGNLGYYMVKKEDDRINL